MGNYTWYETMDAITFPCHNRNLSMLINRVPCIPVHKTTQTLIQVHTIDKKVFYRNQQFFNSIRVADINVCSGNPLVSIPINMQSISASDTCTNVVSYLSIPNHRENVLREYSIKQGILV